MATSGYEGGTVHGQSNTTMKIGLIQIGKLKQDRIYKIRRNKLACAKLTAEFSVFLHTAICLNGTLLQ